MATEDISRNAFSPSKRYAGVHMQQGRVTTDDDFNEQARIEAEDRRRTLLDVIGPNGSPDAGFQISNPRINAHSEMDFDVATGTYYLGGLRLESFGEVYSKQTDWLQQPASERPAPTNGRLDLVYLESWQQPVEAVEDSELFETALAGPDTSTRVRTMRRVHVARGVSGTDCAPAWQGVVSGLAGTYGTFDAAAGECVPDSKLQVTFSNTGVTDDLCSPSVAGGYLGAENTAIRVQIVDGTHLTWGFDNGSPLYRVTIAADRLTVTLQTEPKDQAHWMQGNQVVEILPWSAVLSNKEKLAEISGHLTTVAAAYDPNLRTLTLTSPIPNIPAPGFGKQWTTRDDFATLNAPAPFYFMRVWDRGGDIMSAPNINFMPGMPVTLGNTGVLVTLTGTKFASGDHWVIAARPEDPTKVVPWDLLQGRARHGIRRFFTPLGLIRWKVSGSDTTGTTVQDCRTLFDPLTRQRSCCTFTVGEFGHYRKIQDAIDNLPADGGCICILPGRYEQDFQVIGRRNITIEGCGLRTVILGASPSANSAVASIVDSEWVTLRSLSFKNLERIAVQLVDRVESATLLLPAELVGTDRTVDPNRPRLTRIELEDLAIEGRDMSAVVAGGGNHIELLESKIHIDSLTADFAPGSTAGRWPAVFVAADDVLIEKNAIIAQEQRQSRRKLGENGPGNIAPGVLMNRSRVALGGIQLAGGCERVEIRRNLVTGGAGNGVTLGSIALVPQKAYTGFLADFDYLELARAWTYLSPGFTLVIDENGCIQFLPEPPLPNGPDGKPLVPVSTGALSDIRIVDNDIAEMGQSGIGVVRFFDLTVHKQFITVDRLTIEDNRIHKCLRVELKEMTGALGRYAAYGAIALADGEDVVIRLNTIESNGTSYVDPICGVFVLLVEGLAVLGNVVRDNGPLVRSAAKARPGIRGGIVVGLARQPAEVAPLTAGFGTLHHITTEENVSGFGARPAARIFDNVVVCQDGQALILRALGPASVTRNSFTTRGATSLAANFSESQLQQSGVDLSATWFGATVVIENLGVNGELGAIASFAVASHQRLEMLDEWLRLPEGPTLFAENQVMLDVQAGRDGFIVSSVSILALDDVAVLDNQFSVRSRQDILLTDLLAIGWSLRATNNRLSETLLHAFISGLAIGLLCTVAHNQSTHCLWVISLIGAYGRVNKDNLSMVDALGQLLFEQKLCPVDDDGLNN